MNELQVVSERRPVRVATWSEVPDRMPVGVAVDGIDLVIIRRGDEHSVLYGRCLHRGRAAGRRPRRRATTCCAACTAGTTASTPA